MSDKIISELARLRAEYLEQLPGRLDDIRRLFRLIGTSEWDGARFDDLHRLVHSLVGSSGTFGLPRVAEAARTLELTLAALTDRLHPQVAELEGLESSLLRLDVVLQSELNTTAPTLLEPQGLPRRDLSPLVYIVEDDLDQASQLMEVLQREDYRVRHFAELDDFVQAGARDEEPALIIMDMVFPEGDVAGAEAIDKLRHECLHCPPALFLSVRDDIKARLAAYRTGACRYLVKPVDNDKLLRVVGQLTNRMPATPYRVMLVDDEPLLLQAQADVLAQAGLEVRTISEPLQALEVIKQFQPEVLVLDVYMPEVSGPELAALLREGDAYATLPILFLSSESDISKQLLALNLGGDDFLLKPVDPQHLITAVVARARRYREHSTNTAALERTFYEREREHLALNQHAIVSITDVRGNIIYANDRFCEISGYSREELLGQNHRIIKSERHTQEFFREMWQTVTAGKVWNGEVCNRSKGGEEYWVESTIVPFLNEHGKPYQYVSVRTDITKIKRLELESSINAERLRRSQIFANIGTWDWDIPSGELFWSERIAPLFGYPAGELETTYENFLNAVHPDDRDAVTAAVAACVEQGVEYNIEHRVVWPDGAERWVQEKGDVVRNDAGEPLHMLGVVIDIHDRKLAEEALAVSRQRLVEAQQLARVGNWEADLVKGTLEWSDVIYEIFGYQPQSFEPSMTAFKKAIHPDDRKLVEESELRAKDTGTHDVVHRIIRPSGEVRYIHELARGVVDEEGQLVRFVGTVQDITERKQAEQDLEIFRRIFETTEQGIGVSDASGHLVYTNSAHDQVHGYAHGECNGKHFETFLSDETREWAVPAIIGAVQQGNGWAGLLPIVRSDGSEVVTAANVGFIPGDDGRPQYLFNIMSDYTPELRRQQQLAEARDEAEQASQAKSEFLSSMSHELRTPMNAILGFAQILEFDEGLDEEQQDNVHEIIKAGNHLLELINEVLDLAKIESGRIDLSLEPVPVDDLVEDCFHLVAPVAGNYGIEIAHGDLASYSVRADRTRLKQVLINLLSNAIKYNRSNGRVELTVQPVDGERLRVSVTDTGHGIAADKLQELFVPFNRLTAENSEIEGTGIGLAITRRLMQMMGGDIGVESEVGVGSRFWVELPAEQLPSAGQEAEEGDSASLSSVGDGRSHTVLYIEDNPANLKLVSQIMGRRKHIQLLTAHAPELGLELASVHKPELILLDINMPRMDGYQVLSRLKQTDGLNDIPVVAITANAMPRDIERGKGAGFTDYLTKPLDVTSFLQVVDGCLGVER